MNYELTDEGLRTSDPVIAAMFLGMNISEDSGLLAITDDDDTPFVVRYTNGYEAPYWLITIPYPAVWQSIQINDNCPKYGWFGWTDQHEDFNSPIYGLEGVRVCAKVLACPLTTGKTVGELRDLIAKCEEKA